MIAIDSTIVMSPSSRSTGVSVYGETHFLQQPYDPEPSALAENSDGHRLFAALTAPGSWQTTSMLCPSGPITKAA